MIHLLDFEAEAAVRKLAAERGCSLAHALDIAARRGLGLPEVEPPRAGRPARDRADALASLPTSLFSITSLSKHLSVSYNQARLITRGWEKSGLVERAPLRASRGGWMYRRVGTEPASH